MVGQSVWAVYSAVSRRGRDGERGGGAEAYCSRTQLSGLTVFDLDSPGSGTTVVEAVKLGATVIGWDINPVATLVQRQAVQQWDTSLLHHAYGLVEKSCRAEIDRVHRAETGETVLCYFWVALAPCPACHEDMRLFSSHVFSQNAYPKRVPAAQIVCPVCLDLMPGRYDFTSMKCASDHEFSAAGAVRRSSVACAGYGHVYKVLDALGGEPPRYEMYAKIGARI